MKRAWKLIAIILLACGVLYEEYHRAETIKNHMAPVALRDPADAPFQIRASNFSDNVDLWGDPCMKPVAVGPSYASLALQEELHPASFEKFHARLEYQAEPVLTVENRQLVYSLLGGSTFNLKLNFKPAFPTPDTFIPNRITPGISGSFNF